MAENRLNVLWFLNLTYTKTNIVKQIKRKTVCLHCARVCCENIKILQAKQKPECFQAGFNLNALRNLAITKKRATSGFIKKKRD